MKRLLLTLSLVINICALSPQPVKKHGQLSVSGANIVDMNAQIVTLKGISLGWHNWWPQYYNPSAVEHLARSWNISVIRAAMGIAPEGGYLDRPEQSEAIIKTVVDAAIANSLYVIIDWHSHDLYTEQAVDFFSRMAQQYASYPNIIYEIFNEPDNISWTEIKDYSIKVIEAIRKHDSKNLILAGTRHCSLDADVAADDPITGYNNIAYTLHFYAASHKDDIRQKAQYAINKGLPLFVSECSPSHYDGNGKPDKKEFSKWLKFLKQNNISFIIWGLYDKDETAAMLKHAANPNGKWPASQLTETGYYARQIISGKTALPQIISITALLVIITITFIKTRKK